MSKNSKNATDICGSIHSSDKVDPFEGLDLGEICVSPSKLDASKSSAEDRKKREDEKLFGLNPLDDIDLKDMSVDPDSMPSPPLTDQGSKKAGKASHPASSENDVDFIILPKDDSEEEARQERQRYKRPEHHLSTNITHPPIVQPSNHINPIIEKACHYAELTQIRQQIFASLEETGGNTLLIASSHDNTGSSLLASALAYNTACSCQQSVLLIDCNMRRAGLHEFFYVPQSYGFTDLIRDNLPWQAVVRETNISGLSIITAGDPVDNFSEYLRYAHIPNLVQDIRNEYDLIIFDTSPILKPNRNNVNIVSLTAIADYFLLVTKKSGTTKAHLKEAQDIIEAGNGKIDGIVLNEHTPEKKPAPYKQ